MFHSLHGTKIQCVNSIYQSVSSYEKQERTEPLKSNFAQVLKSITLQCTAIAPSDSSLICKNLSNICLGGHDPSGKNKL